MHSLEPFFVPGKALIKSLFAFNLHVDEDLYLFVLRVDVFAMTSLGQDKEPGERFQSIETLFWIHLLRPSDVRIKLLKRILRAGSDRVKKIGLSKLAEVGGRNLPLHFREG